MLPSQIYSDEIGHYIDGIFAEPLGDRELDAVSATEALFDASFPGWTLYKTVVLGDEESYYSSLHWAIMSAIILAESHKRDGSEFAARKKWLNDAAKDALDLVRFGPRSQEYKKRSAVFSRVPSGFIRFRNAVAGGIQLGVDRFRFALHMEYLTALNPGNPVYACYNWAKVYGAKDEQYQVAGEAGEEGR